jgi:hypothetical protein
MPSSSAHKRTWIEQLKQKINLPKGHAIFCLHPLQKSSIVISHSPALTFLPSLV